MKRLIYILLLAVLTLACKKDNPVLDGGEEVEVTINLASGDMPQTKTVGPQAMKVGSTVSVFAYRDADGVFIAQKTFKVSEDNTLKACIVNEHGVVLEGEPLDGNLMRLPSLGTYKFRAISPAVQSDDDGLATSPLLFVAHKGASELDSLCDLLYSSNLAPVDFTSKTYTATLDNFKHRFSQIKMKFMVTAIGGADVSVGDGGVSITLQNAGPESIDILTGDFATTVADHNKVLTFAKGDFKKDETETGLTTIYNSDSLIVFPTNLANEPLTSYTFKINTSVKVAYKTFTFESGSIPVKILEGKAHVFTLKYDDNGMELFLTVLPTWNTVAYGANFGESVSYLLGGWTNEGGVWDNKYESSTSYSDVTWVPADKWAGDFGEGFETRVENYNDFNTGEPGTTPPDDGGFDDGVGGTTTP